PRRARGGAVTRRAPRALPAYRGHPVGGAAGNEAGAAVHTVSAPGPRDSRRPAGVVATARGIHPAPPVRADIPGGRTRVLRPDRARRLSVCRRPTTTGRALDLRRASHGFPGRSAGAPGGSHHARAAVAHVLVSPRLRPGRGAAAPPRSPVVPLERRPGGRRRAGAEPAQCVAPEDQGPPRDADGAAGAGRRNPLS